MSIFFIPIIASKVRFASSPPAASASVSTRGSPLVFAPPALALLPAITDDCVPIAVRLLLIFGCNLEREGFVMLEHWTAVEAETGYAEDREFDRQLVALLSAGIIAGGSVHSTD